MDDIPSSNIKLLVSDMNAKIDNKRQRLEHVISLCRSASQMSDNRDYLLLFCSMNNLCIRNTYFTHISIHKVTWWSPDGSNCNEIEYFYISRQWHSAFLDLRTYHGNDIRSDHYLIMASLDLYFKKKEQEYQPTEHYAVKRLRDQTSAEQYSL